MELAYPFRVSGAGRTAAAQTYEEHIRGLIEQVLFTTPGERVNRPDFGSGLMRFVFATGGEETLVAVQFMVQGALQEWLGDLIDVQAVDVSAQEATLNVSVRYTILRSGQPQVAAFTS